MTGRLTGWVFPEDSTIMKTIHMDVPDEIFLALKETPKEKRFIQSL
jgi:hypothetical protein